MSLHSVVGVYNTIEEAEDAIRHLTDNNVAVEQISIITNNISSEKKLHGYVTTGDVAKEGAANGAWFGGLFGLLIGAAFIWVPGAGPIIVAGPFAAALLGALEGVAAGAVGGGLLGALFGWGVSKQHILKYEEHITDGRHLVAVNGTWEEVEKAHDLLKGTNTESLNLHENSEAVVTE